MTQTLLHPGHRRSTYCVHNLFAEVTILSEISSFVRILQVCYHSVDEHSCKKGAS